MPADGSGLATFLRVLGPGYLVAVGYMDPGNWATDLAAGSHFGYKLLWVVGVSSLMAMVLQSLCCRLGIASGMDLAEACAKALPSPLRIPLWLLAELAIVACDLAELVGSAIALQLLFGLPLPWGVALTALDTLLLLLLQRWGIRRLEAVVIAMVALIGGCFAVELLLLQPSWPAIGQGFIPQASTLLNGEELFLAAGILGATVMPHNLYLHSSLVKSRQWETKKDGRKQALSFSTLDALIALSLAFLVNAAILVLAGGQLLWTARSAGHRSQPGLSPADANLGHIDRECAVWDCPAGVGPKFDPDRHDGGPSGDGGISQHPLARLATTPGDPVPGPDPRHGDGDRAGGFGDQQVAGVQPGVVELATPVCGHSLGVALQPTQPHGRAGGPPLAAAGGLEFRWRDRADQWSPADFNRRQHLVITIQ